MELARNVYVLVGNLEARFSDNYFDLLPGEPVTITIKSEGTLDQIKQALKVTSLMDSFVNHRQQATGHSRKSKTTTGLPVFQTAVYSQIIQDRGWIIISKVDDCLFFQGQRLAMDGLVGDNICNLRTKSELLPGQSCGLDA